MSEINTHGYVMERGKHQGELITRVPVSYLKWMVRENHTDAAYAAAELSRRGTVTPSLDVSGHAIDRASLRLLDRWQATRGEDEGLSAWLTRVGAEALANGEKRGDKVAYDGMLFAFELEGKWPVLKTVMPDKKAKRQAAPFDSIDAEFPENGVTG